MLLQVRIFSFRFIFSHQKGCRCKQKTYRGRISGRWNSCDEWTRNYPRGRGWISLIQKNIRNFGFKSLPGQVDKVPKTNQDAYIVFPSIDEEKTIHLFSVADGHGTILKLNQEFKVIMSQDMSSKTSQVSHESYDKRFCDRRTWEE